ncbi:MAG: hypothetical protein JW871_05380 [Endomicrobiales bacterium]|nr:hypothetical protein [Endomicrobiales bacterium]
MSSSHKKIIIGVETEAYSINLSDYAIGRRYSKHRPGTREIGERFLRDSSIGSEYNSKPFTTVREAFFLLKSGFRKYLHRVYHSSNSNNNHPVPLLVGTWTNHFAGTHLHVSIAKKKLTYKEASSLAWHIHDHIPFLIAVAANSPVWRRKISNKASNRILYGTKKYFTPVKKGRLEIKDKAEVTYNHRRKSKPPTLELRVFDSNIPEYTVVLLCFIKAISLRWLKGKSAINNITYKEYMQSRNNAANLGMKAKLCWNNEWISVRKYLDRFLWAYRDEFDLMDIPEDIYEVLRLIKLGYNGSKVIYDAAIFAQKEYPKVWEKEFARLYDKALEELLNGNSIHNFANSLKLKLPETENVWLGRRRASIDE